MAKIRPPKSISTFLLFLFLISNYSSELFSQSRNFLGGKVLDQTTLTPIPGVNVVLLDSDPLVGASTDIDGRFLIPDVLVGRYELRLSIIGYESKIVSEILVISGRQTELVISLSEAVFEGQELEVVARVEKEKALNDMTMISARSFSVEETQRYAGGLDDPARMVTGFAGVSSSGDVGSNAILVRGNSSRGVLWRVEGVDIPIPSHFADLSVAGGGGITLFSGQVLSNSDFLSGAFPAEYGNALAGVFDINFREGNSRQRESAVQIGLLGLEAAFEGPTGILGGSYLINYRYSTLALLLPLLPTDDEIAYQDLSFKITLPSRRFGKWSIWGIGGKDGQSSTPVEASEREFQSVDSFGTELDMDRGAIGISNTMVIGDQSYLK